MCTSVVQQKEEAPRTLRDFLGREPQVKRGALEQVTVADVTPTRAREVVRHTDAEKPRLGMGMRGRGFIGDFVLIGLVVRKDRNNLIVKL